MADERALDGRDLALLAAGLLALGLAVLASATRSPPYPVVVGGLLAGMAALGVLGFRQGPDVDPFTVPVALKLAIVAATVLFQPSLVGRDPHFELAVTRRLIEQGTWSPGMGFASHKASGYAHYPGLSFVASSLAIPSGIDAALLARLLPPAFAVVGLVLLIALSRSFTEDDRLALGVGTAWACFSLANVFQAQYVHEALGFPLFLAAAYLAFNGAASGLRPSVAFVLVGLALVFTHHLTSAFLLVLLALYALAHARRLRAGEEVRDLGPVVAVGVFAVCAAVYSRWFGNPEVFGYAASFLDTLQVLVADHVPMVSGPTTPDPNDPYVKQALGYERRGRDVFLFVARLVFVAGLWLVAVVNVLLRNAEESLSSRHEALLLWAGSFSCLLAGLVAFNVTVGLDPARTLPWAFVFLLVLAASVPASPQARACLRERVEAVGETVGRAAEGLPSPSTHTTLVFAFLVAFAGFQLLSLPPYLLSEERDPAYYRTQVRTYYHEDEQATAAWIQAQLDPEAEIYGDMTTHELVGPTGTGEVNNTRPSVYLGQKPPDDSYIVWRDEMRDGLLSWNQRYEHVFVTVSEEQRRALATDAAYAELYATPRTAVYAFQS